MTGLYTCVCGKDGGEKALLTEAVRNIMYIFKVLSFILGRCGLVLVGYEYEQNCIIVQITNLN